MAPPGGLTPREAFPLVRRLCAESNVVGFELVELNPLVDKQTRAYRGNIERTVRASEGQQKLARARRAGLDRRYGDSDRGFRHGFQGVAAQYDARIRHRPLGEHVAWRQCGTPVASQ